MGGRADTGLGERDDDEEEEEEDIGHSREFMSWRLRQKAVTCSVLCKKTETSREEMKSKSCGHLLCGVLHPVTSAGRKARLIQYLPFSSLGFV